MFNYEICLDLETITDPRVVDDCPPDPATGGGFAPPVAHEIVCASVLMVEYNWFEGTPNRFAVRSWSRQRHTEQEIIAAVERILPATETVEKRLIGFNSRGFDIPVLVARSMATLCPAMPRLAAMRSLARRDERHLDLQEHVGANSGRTGTLAQACRYLSIPVKTSTHGSDVAALAAADDWRAIEQYCEEDVVATWLLSRHVEKARFHVNAANVWVSWARLSGWITKNQPRQQHLQQFCAHPLVGKMAPILAKEARAARFDLDLEVGDIE
jgi:predicted PolB exonuclease-like 3'-5' exonuclease